MFFRLFRLIRGAGRDLVVLWYACRHARTPVLTKLLAVLLAVYIISPVDLMSDFLPVLGWLDDVTLVAFLLPLIMKLLPESAIRDGRAASERLFARWRPFRRGR